MNQNNVYYALIEYWSRDKSKTPNNLQALIGANPIKVSVELSNTVLRTLKSVISESGEYYLQTNDAGVMLSYEDKPTGVILENEHLTYQQMNLDIAVAIVQTLPSIDVILKDIQTVKASKIPEIPESALNVISDCFHKLNGNGGYTNLTADNVPYNDYLLTISYRIMLSNVLYSIANDKAINNEYNAYTVSQISKQIKSIIIKYRLIKDTLPKNCEIVIAEKVSEWIVDNSISLEDKLKNIGMW